MIYHLDASGRFTGETSDRTMQWYIDSDFIPRTVTDIAPPEPLPDHEVVFNGREWVQWEIEQKPEPGDFLSDEELAELE